MLAKLPHLLAAGAYLLLAACVAPSGGNEPAPASAAPLGPAALSSNLVEGLGASPAHARFLDSVRAAGLEATLAGSGPYTIFAPTDQALDRLPRGTLEALRAPQARALFARLLNYHVVPGVKTRAQIARDAAGGVATYRTLNGGLIRVSASSGEIVVTDHHGNRISGRGAEAVHANGVLHTLDGVLLPQT
jgi:uncharacterized surface protein with fasciclin (FAS1) repeats